jgi:ribosome maturation protein SDO1
VIKLLQKTMPITRAMMRLKISIPEKDGLKLKERLKTLISKVEQESFDLGWDCVIFFCFFVYYIYKF